MLTILATCLLYGTMTFTPPIEWQILSITSYGSYYGGSMQTGCMVPPCAERPIVQIELKRTLEPGKVLEAPKGCTLSLKHEKE